MMSADGSQAQPAATGQPATTLALTGDGLLMEVIVMARGSPSAQQGSDRSCRSTDFPCGQAKDLFSAIDKPENGVSLC